MIWKREREGHTHAHSHLPFAGSSPKWPMLPKLQKPRARSFILVLHIDARIQALGPFFATFPGSSAWSWVESAACREEPVPIWNAFITGSELGHNASVSVPTMLFFKCDHDYLIFKESVMLQHALQQQSNLEQHTDTCINRLPNPHLSP